MKKIETIEVAATPAHKREVVTYICDFCGHTSNESRSLRICIICDRHACRGDLFRKGCGKDDPEEIGDYPAAYCPNCYRLRFETHKQSLSNLEQEYDDKREHLIQLIKEDSDWRYKEEHEK